jgi:hypothetical protein
VALGSLLSGLSREGLAMRCTPICRALCNDETAGVGPGRSRKGKARSWRGGAGWRSRRVDGWT